MCKIVQDWYFGGNDFTIELLDIFNVPADGVYGNPNIFVGIPQVLMKDQNGFLVLTKFRNIHSRLDLSNRQFGSFKPNINQWYHFAITRTSSEWRVFVDGVRN